MAIPQSDGSIILSTKVDTSGVNKGLNGIKSTVKKIGSIIAVAFGVRALVNFGKEAINLASDLQEVQNVVDVSFGNMRQAMEDFADTAIETYGISKLTAKQTGSSYMAMARGMNIAEKEASDMALTLTGLSADMASFYNIRQDEARTALSAVFTGETETLKRYGILITEVNLQEFARQQGITKSVNAMTQQEKVMLRYNYILKSTQLAQGDFARTQDSWANQTRILSERWKEMQTIFGEAFIRLATLVLPIINKVIDGLVKIAEKAKIASDYIYELFTGKKFQDTSEGISQATEAQDGFTEAIEGTASAQEKFLAGFDKVTKISDSSGGAGGTGTSIAESLNVAPESAGNSAISEEADKIANELANIMKIAGGALLAIGLILLVTGHPLWGIAFVIAGALLFVSGKAVISKTDVGDKVGTLLGDIMLIVGGALLAIGALLCTLGHTGWGVAFIIAGAGIFVSGAATLSEGMLPKKVQEVIDGILALSAGLMLVIGFIMVMSGHITPISIALLIGGATLLVTEVALNWDEMSNKTKTFISVMMGIIGAGLLVLGILVLPSNMALGIGLIIAGVSGLVAPVALNWDAIVEKVKGFFNNIVGIWKKAVENIIKFFGWITDGWKEIGDGLVSAMKAVGNFFIDIFNGLIKGINKAIGAINKIPGVELTKLKSIPHLAQGAVIPPNREFLAVLGDQKSGTNIEAPLSTIKQAVAEVLAGASRGGNSAETIELVVNLDGAVIYKSVVNRNKQNTIRTGKNALAY